MIPAQGTVVFNDLVANVTTNSAISHFVGGSETGGFGGKIASTAGLFYFQLFIQPYTGTLSASATNILDYGWEAATVYGTSTYVTATNRVIAGAVVGVGGNTGVAVNNWALPTASYYSTSGRNYFMIAGWSADFGTSWAEVSGKVASGFYDAGRYFGVSGVGNAYAAGAFSLTPQSLFVTSAATPQGLGTSMVLYQIVPEPSTFVLVGLGGISLLLLLRRK